MKAGCVVIRTARASDTVDDMKPTGPPEMRATQAYITTTQPETGEEFKILPGTLADTTRGSVELVRSQTWVDQVAV